MTAVVVHPGVHSAVVDGGVTGRAHQGVSRGGFADPLAAALANGLVENAADVAVLEMVLQGAVLRFDRPARVALAGSANAALLDDKPLALWRAIDVEAGQTLRVGACSGGLRATLAVRGGLLPSAPPLMRGASLQVGAAPRVPARPVPTGLPPPRAVDGVVVLRATAAPAMLSGGHGERAWTTTFVVLPDSDRRALRLVPDDGVPLAGGEIVSAGVVTGTLQLPPSGPALLLGVDQTTTGGYAVPLHVASVDLWWLGQLRPGDKVRFARIEHAAARELVRTWKNTLGLSTPSPSSAAISAKIPPAS